MHILFRTKQLLARSKAAGEVCMQNHPLFQVSFWKTEEKMLFIYTRKRYFLWQRKKWKKQRLIFLYKLVTYKTRRHDPTWCSFVLIFMKKIVAVCADRFLTLFCLFIYESELEDNRKKTVLGKRWVALRVIVQPILPSHTE